jgi:hypothetical protein
VRRKAGYTAAVSLVTGKEVNAGELFVAGRWLRQLPPEFIPPEGL